MIVRRVIWILMIVIVRFVRCAMANDLFSCDFEHGSCDIMYKYRNITHIVEAKYFSPYSDITFAGGPLGHFIRIFGQVDDEVKLTTPLLYDVKRRWKCLDFWFTNANVLDQTSRLTVYEMKSINNAVVNSRLLKSWTLHYTGMEKWKKGSVSFIPDSFTFSIGIVIKRYSSRDIGLTLDELHVHNSRCAEVVYPSCKNPYRYFRCRNGKCIDKKLVCNYFDDCDDNSDEGAANACHSSKSVPPKRDKDQLTIIIGASVIGSMVFVLIVGLVIFVTYRYRQRVRQREENASTQQLDTISQSVGNTSRRRSSISAFFATLVPPPSYRNVFPRGPPSFRRNRRMTPPPSYEQSIDGSTQSLIPTLLTIIPSRNLVSNDGDTQQNSTASEIILSPLTVTSDVRVLTDIAETTHPPESPAENNPSDISMSDIVVETENDKQECGNDPIISGSTTNSSSEGQHCTEA